MYPQFLNSISFPILDLSVKFVSQICHENINKQLDGAYLADFGIDIIEYLVFNNLRTSVCHSCVRLVMKLLA